MIDHVEWVDLIISRGPFFMVEHLINKVVTLLVEFYILLIFSTNMIKLGLKIDLNWYNQIKKLLKIVEGKKKTDNMDKLCV